MEQCTEMILRTDCFFVLQCDNFWANRIQFSCKSIGTRKMGVVAVSRWELQMIEFFYDWFEWYHVRAPTVDWTERSTHQRCVTNGGHTFIARIFISRTERITLRLEVVTLYYFSFFFSFLLSLLASNNSVCQPPPQMMKNYKIIYLILNDKSLEGTWRIFNDWIYCLVFFFFVFHSRSNVALIIYGRLNGKCINPIIDS